MPVLGWHYRQARSVPRWAVGFLLIGGWRYSEGRQLWVHRIGNGRFGPMFRVHSSHAEPEHNHN